MLRQSNTSASDGSPPSSANISTSSKIINHSDSIQQIPMCRRVQSAVTNMEHCVSPGPKYSSRPQQDYRSQSSIFGGLGGKPLSPLPVVAPRDSAEANKFTPQNSSPTPSPSISNAMNQSNASSSSQSTARSDIARKPYSSIQDNHNASSVQCESHDDTLNDFAAIVRHFEYHALNQTAPPPRLLRSPVNVPAIAPTVTAFETAISSAQQSQPTIVRNRGIRSPGVLAPPVDDRVDESQPKIFCDANSCHPGMYCGELKPLHTGSTESERQESITSTSGNGEPRLTEGTSNADKVVYCELSNNTTDSSIHSSSTVIRDYNREAGIQRFDASFNSLTPNPQKHEINVSTVVTERLHRPHYCQPPTPSSLPDRPEVGIFTRSPRAQSSRLSWTKTPHEPSVSVEVEDNSEVTHSATLTCDTRQIPSHADADLSHEPTTRPAISLHSVLTESGNTHATLSENSNLSSAQQNNFSPQMSAKYGPLGAPDLSSSRFSDPGASRGFLLVPAPPARPVSSRAPAIASTQSVATVFGVAPTVGLSDSGSLNTVTELGETQSYTHQSSTHDPPSLSTTSYRSGFQNPSSSHDELQAYFSSEEDTNNLCENQDTFSVKSPSQSSTRAHSAFERTMDDLQGDDFRDIDEMMEADLLFDTNLSTGHSNNVPDQGDDFHEVLRRFSGAADDVTLEHRNSEYAVSPLDNLGDDLSGLRTEASSTSPSASCPVISEARKALPLFVTPSVPYLRPSSTTTAPLASSDLELRSSDAIMNNDSVYHANDEPISTNSNLQNIHDDNEEVTESGTTSREKASSVGSSGSSDSTSPIEAFSAPSEAKSDSDLVMQALDFDERHFPSIAEADQSQPIPSSSFHHIPIPESIAEQDLPVSESKADCDLAPSTFHRRPSWSMVKEATKAISVVADSVTPLNSELWNTTSNKSSSAERQETSQVFEDNTVVTNTIIQSQSIDDNRRFHDAGLLPTDAFSSPRKAQIESSSQIEDVLPDKLVTEPTDLQSSSVTKKYSRILSSPLTQEKGSSITQRAPSLKMRSSLDSLTALSESTIRRNAAGVTIKNSRKSLTPMIGTSRRESIDLMNTRLATAIPFPQKRIVQQNISQLNPSIALDRKPKGVDRDMSNRTNGRPVISGTPSRLNPVASPRSTFGTLSRPNIGTSLRSTPGASPRPTPGASPRPTPGASPRPTPGASPRPTPGASPRPTPGASPRPTPGASPRPTPRASPRPSPITSPRASRLLSPTAASPRRSSLHVSSSSLGKPARLADKGGAETEVPNRLLAPTDEITEMSSQQPCVDNAPPHDGCALRRLSHPERTSMDKSSVQTTTEIVDVEQAFDQLSLTDIDHGTPSLLGRGGNNVPGMEKERSSVIASNMKKWQVIGSKDRSQTQRFIPLVSMEVGSGHENENIHANSTRHSSGTMMETSGAHGQLVRQVEDRSAPIPARRHHRTQSLSAPTGKTRRPILARSPISAPQVQSRMCASAKAVAVSSVRRILSFAPERRNPSSSGSLYRDVSSDTKAPSQPEDRKSVVTISSLVPTGRRRRARVTVPKPFSLTGATLQQRTRMAIEEARRRTEEVEKRRRVFRARPMPDFSKPFPPPKSSS